jgi:hypothetical protein
MKFNQKNPRGNQKNARGNQSTTPESKKVIAITAGHKESRVDLAIREKIPDNDSILRHKMSETVRNAKGPKYAKWCKLWTLECLN